MLYANYLFLKPWTTSTTGTTRRTHTQYTHETQHIYVVATCRIAGTTLHARNTMKRMRGRERGKRGRVVQPNWLSKIHSDSQWLRQQILHRRTTFFFLFSMDLPEHKVTIRRRWTIEWTCNCNIFLSNKPCQNHRKNENVFVARVPRQLSH